MCNNYTKQHVDTEVTDSNFIGSVKHNSVSNNNNETKF